ncbi:MAG TPA: ATPase, T2SS/T4P/T4SS family, partial [Geothermobacteraceae bacterium]|nr:ATPase, T2SS/T4P/T4SS family [Geothermobacteraceae bacterium]
MPKIDGLFKILKEKGGSDLHISPENPPLIRVSGALTPAHPSVFNHDQYKVLLYEIMSETQRDEFEQTRDIDFAYEVAAIDSRFRANIFYGRLGISAVFRLIPTKILTIKQLGLPDTLLKFTQFKKGLVLVTGPTGSGKSTTLAAMIDHVNEHRTEHILTVEDPIEFVHRSKKSLINQREVGKHTQSFAAALKAALREDPDIILVGEMRDLE